MKIEGDGIHEVNELIKLKKRRLIMAIVGMFFELSGIGLLVMWYGWRPALIVFIIEFGMNINNSLKYTKQ